MEKLDRGFLVDLGQGMMRQSWHENDAGFWKHGMYDYATISSAVFYYSV